MEFLHNPNVDFLGKTKYFVSLSVAFIALGIGTLATRGIRYGVEFSGGTQLIARFQSTPSIDKIRSAVDKVAAGAVIQTYDAPAKNQVLIRLAGKPEQDLSQEADAVMAALQTGY